MYFWLVCSVDVWGMGHAQRAPVQRHTLLLWTWRRSWLCWALRCCCSLFFLLFFLHDLVFVKPSNRFPVLVVMSARSWPPVTIFLPLWLNMEQQAHTDTDIARGQLHKCRLRLVLNSFVGRRPSPAETYLCCRSTWAIALALVSNWTHPLMSQDIWSPAWNETLRCNMFVEF